MWWKKFSI